MLRFPWSPVVLLAIADDRKPAGWQAPADKIVHRGLRAALAERKVVLVRPPLVGVPLDEHESSWIRLHPVRIRIEDPRGVRPDVVAVEVEMNVLDIRDGHEVPRARSRRRRADRRGCWSASAGR